MNRRSFLKSGVLAGLAGVAGGPSLTACAAWQDAAPEPAAPEPAAAGPLRLNSNENPLGLSPAARQAVLDALPQANRYPFAAAQQLVEKLARRLDVDPEQVVLGNGSTELLQMAIQASASPGAPLVVADPTFEDVLDYRQTFAYRVEKVPLDESYAHDIAAMRRIVDRSQRPAVVYLCNPNNPTATLTPSTEIDRFIANAPQTVFFIVDEAYFEYVEEPNHRSALRWVYDQPNVVVTRTFSKIYGMAGLRLGYGIAHPDTAQRLREWSAFTNANQLALAAALVALDDEEHMARSRQVRKAALDIVTACLDELGLEHLPSHTNFVMHRIRGDLGEYRRRMEEHGFLVGRPFPPMLEYNRLSLGLPREMERFADTLRQFRRQGWV